MIITNTSLNNIFRVLILFIFTFSILGNIHSTNQQNTKQTEQYQSLKEVRLNTNIVKLTNKSGKSIEKNILTQEMLNQSNTRYIIQYDYDLKGEEITIPKGCILDFKGGSFRNGIITGNLNIISKIKIFENITFSECSFYEVRPEWWGATKNGITNDGSAIQDMFDALSSCLKKIEVSNDTYISDYRNTNIIFTGKYYTSTPIVLKDNFGLIINNFNITALPSFTPLSDSIYPSIKFSAIINNRGNSYNMNINNCIIDGNARANGIALIWYSINTAINNSYIRRFKQYGIIGDTNGYELKCNNLKITQREHGYTNEKYKEGIGLYLNSGRNDNNFTNVVISYCKDASFKILSGTNYFINCHFYSGNTYSESGSYNFFNSCYFDGDGIITYGANNITNCFFSSKDEDKNHVFIKLGNIGKPTEWMHSFDVICNNLFKNNTSNTPKYNYPIGTINGSSINDAEFSCFDNLFFNCTQLQKYSTHISSNKQITIKNSGIGSNNESLRIGNLLIQTGEIKSHGTTTITFNQVYESQCHVICSPYNAQSDISKCWAYNISKAGFSISTSCRWIAIGYVK